MKKFKAALVAGLAVTMLFGCGKSSDEAVVGLSIEKLEDVQDEIFPRYIQNVG